MMLRTVLPTVLASALLVAFASAQQGVQVPSSLDEMIATALRTSPDVLLADAKVRQAQAELNQARLKVTRDVVGAFFVRKQRNAELQAAQSKADEMSKRAGAGISSPEMEALRARIEEAQVRHAESEADIRYLIGVGSQIEGVTPRSVSEAPKPKAAPRPNPPEWMVDPLGSPVGAQFDKVPLSDVLKKIGEQAKIAMMVDPQVGVDLNAIEITLALREPVTLVSVLQALADQHDLVFLLRDYGIMVTVEHRARGFRAAAIPQNLAVEPDAK